MSGTSPYPQATLVLVNGVLIDGTGAAALTHAIILLEGEQILAIGQTSTLKAPPNVRTIDLHGAAVLPGFINAHVHYGFNKSNLEAWALGGVTTVRDESATASDIAALKSFHAEIDAEPRYASLVSAGTMMAAPGGYGSLYVNSPAEARTAVLAEIEQGVDLVKVANEDGYGGRHDLPKLTPEELKAIVETAHEKGLPVSGHVTSAAFLQPLLDAGVDDIAHAPSDPISQEALQQMVDQGVFLVPTFTVFRNYGAPVAGQQNNVRRFVELGGVVALGNDYGGGPGDFELGIPMYEVKMLSGSGMTPMQVIQACTLNAAELLRLDSRIGTLEEGKIADIIVVDGNPLDNLENLSKIKMVIHNGVVIRLDLEE